MTTITQISSSNSVNKQENDYLSKLSTWKIKDYNNKTYEISLVQGLTSKLSLEEEDWKKIEVFVKETFTSEEFQYIKIDLKQKSKSEASSAFEIRLPAYEITGLSIDNKECDLSLKQMETIKIELNKLGEILRDVKNLTISSSMQYNPQAPMTLDHYDVGGGGYCADLSLADQFYQLSPDSFKDKTLTKDEYLKKIAKAQRKQIAEFILNQNPIEQNLYVAIVENLKTVKSQKPEVLKDLTDSFLNGAALSNTDQKKVLKVYTDYIAQEGSYLDYAFFIAATQYYDKQGLQIAVLQDAPPQQGIPYQIVAHFPNHCPIIKEKCLFIWFNKPSFGGIDGSHYHSFDRKSPLINASIEHYKIHYFETDFLPIITNGSSSKKAVLDAFKTLKVIDPLTYKLICFHSIKEGDRETKSPDEIAREGEAEILRSHFILVALAIQKDKILADRNTFELKKKKLVKKI